MKSSKTHAEEDSLKGKRTTKRMGMGRKTKSTGVIALALWGVCFMAPGQGKITPVSWAQKTNECAIYGSNPDGIPYKNSTAPQKLNEKSLKNLQDVCPNFYHTFGGKEGEYCCSNQQVDLLQTKLSLLHGIVVGCPACDYNFKHLWCYMTCAPYQSDFLEVIKTKNDTNGAVLADTVNFYVAADFGADLFNSCKDVKVSSMNVKAMDTLCKSANCTGWHMMLSKQGEKFPLLNPISIKFPINSTDSKVPEDIHPINDTLPTCYDSVFGCSCGDCPEGPSCVKPEPPPPPSPTGCVALGFPAHSLSCMDFSVLLSFFAMTITTILYLGFNKKTLDAISQESENGKEETLEQPLVNSKAGSSDLETSDDGVLYANVSVQDESKELLYAEQRPLVLPPVEQWLHEWFYKQGVWIASHPWITIIFTLIFIVLALIGLVRFKVETSPEELWVPSGSSCKSDKAHFDKSFGKFYRIEQLIITQEDTSSNVSIASDDTIKMMFDIQDEVDSISIQLDNGKADLKSICYKPFGPDGECATQSVLQYWQMNRKTFENAADNADGDPEWKEFCFQHWITEESCFSAYKAPMDPKLVFGGYPKDKGIVNYSKEARSLIVVYTVDNSDDNMNAALAFEDAFINLAGTKLKEMVEKRGLKLSYSSESSVEKELKRESNADAITVALSFLAMFVYMTIVLGGVRSCQPSLIGIRSRVLLGLGGVILVLCSVACAAGILSAFGLKSTLLIVEVIPFLALAIGVDNMCILAHALQNQDSTLPTAIRVGNALSSAGPSITLAASAEVLAFLAGLLTGMPACMTFALFAAVTIFIDYIFQVTAFVAMLLLDEERILNSRMDCMPCIRDHRPHDTEVTWGKYGPIDCFMASLSEFLRNKLAQGIVIVVFFGGFLAAIACIPHLDLGLEQTVALPRDSYLQDYFKDIASQLRVGPPVYFVVRDMNLDPQSPDVNKTCATAGCFPDSFLNQVERAAESPHSTYIATAAASWIDDYIAWINPSLNKCCRMYSNETYCPVNSDDDDCETCFDGNSDDPLFHLHGSRPTVKQIIKTLPWFMESIPCKDCSKAGAGAYNSELEKSSKDPTGYKGVSDGMVEASRFRGYHTPLSTQKDFIDALKNAKDLTKDASKKLGLNIYPYSVFYVFFEQYLHMQNYALVTFSLAAAGILLICYAFLGSLWAALMTVFVVMLIIVDMMGCMYFMKVQFNAVSLTNLAMSVGIALEFCVHIVRAFCMSDGTREYRASWAMKQMGTPVFNGITLTKLIGVLVLSLSHTAIFQIYYFRMYLSLVVISTLHAFILLPVLMMLFGPPKLKYATPLIMADELVAKFK